MAGGGSVLFVRPIQPQVQLPTKRSLGLALILKPPVPQPSKGGMGLKILRPVRPRTPYVGSPPHYASWAPYFSEVIQPKVQQAGPARRGLFLRIGPPRASAAAATGKVSPPLVVSRYASSRRDGQGFFIRPPLSAPPSIPSIYPLPRHKIILSPRYRPVSEPIWSKPPRYANPTPGDRVRQPILTPASVKYPAPFRGAFIPIAAPLVALAPAPPVGGSSMTCDGITIFEAIQGRVLVEEEMTGIVLLED